MNELQVVGTTDQTPIEVLLQVGEDGRVSAKNAYEFLQMHPRHFARWCKSNIVENEFAEDGVDYEGAPLMVNGNLTTDYRLSVPFAKKLCMLSKTPRGEQARDYFIAVEDRLKLVAQQIPQLSPNEMILKMAEANVELEKRLNARVEVIEQTVLESAVQVETALKVFSRPGNNWRDEMYIAVTDLIESHRLSQPQFWRRLYSEVEAAASVNLNRKLSNLKKRMKKQGASKTECDSMIRLDAISHDRNLRPIFENVVRKYQAIHGAGVAK